MVREFNVYQFESVPWNQLLIRAASWILDETCEYYRRQLLMEAEIYSAHRDSEAKYKPAFFRVRYDYHLPCSPFGAAPISIQRLQVDSETLLRRELEITLSVWKKVRPRQWFSTAPVVACIRDDQGRWREVPPHEFHFLQLYSRIHALLTEEANKELLANGSQPSAIRELYYRFGCFLRVQNQQMESFLVQAIQTP